MLLAENQLNAKGTTTKSSSPKAIAPAISSYVQPHPAMSSQNQKCLREITRKSASCSSLRAS